jgi:hypothetical protein
LILSPVFWERAMAKKETSGTLVKHSKGNYVKKLMEGFAKDPNFQASVNQRCATSAPILAQKRRELQVYMATANELMKRLDSGKLSEKDTADAYQKISSLTTVATMYGLALLSDLNSIRVLKTKKLPNGEKQLLEVRARSTAALLQDCLANLESMAMDSEVQTRIIHGLAKKLAPEVLKGTIEDENGVKTEVDDIYADYFDPDEVEEEAEEWIDDDELVDEEMEKAQARKESK